MNWIIIKKTKETKGVYIYCLYATKYHSKDNKKHMNAIIKSDKNRLIKYWYHGYQYSKSKKVYLYLARAKAV